MPINILFVCMGNICRSPAAEGVMKALLKQHGIEKKIHCDSAGTISYHAGEPPDARMREHAQKRGYHLSGRSRPFNAETDFEIFDYIITMDNENYSDVQSMDLRGQYGAKIRKMVEFCHHHDVQAVPDPYYGGTDGFDLVLNLLEDACQGLLESVQNEQGI